MMVSLVPNQEQKQWDKWKEKLSMAVPSSSTN